VEHKADPAKLFRFQWGTEPLAQYWRRPSPAITNHAMSLVRSLNGTDGPSVVLNAVEVDSHEFGVLFNNPSEVEVVQLWKNPGSAIPNLATSLVRFPIGTNGPIVVPVAAVEANPELEWLSKKPKAMVLVQLCQKLDDATLNNATSPAKYRNGMDGQSAVLNAEEVSKPEPVVLFNSRSAVEAVQLWRRPGRATPSNATFLARYLNGTVGQNAVLSAVVDVKPEQDESFNSQWEAGAVRH
jgi:hypothetical protein